MRCTPLRNDVTANTEPTSAAPPRHASPTGPPTVPSEPSRPPATKNEVAAPGGEVRGERDRVGVAEEPVGEQDVDGVGRGGAERHADTDEVGVGRSSSDERDAAEDPDQRDEATTRQPLAADHRRDADDEHEMGVVDERGERSRRALQRAEEEGRVERVHDRAENEGSERGAARDPKHLAPREHGQQEGGREVAPGKHAGHRGAVGIGDLHQHR